MRWKGQKRGEELRGGSEWWLADWPESWEVGVLGEGAMLGFCGEGVRGGIREATLDPGWPQSWEAQQEKERQDALLVHAGAVKQEGK